MRKTTICICENKGTDQLGRNCEADQRLCFRYMDSTIPLLPASVATQVGLSRIPKLLVFSRTGSFMLKQHFCLSMNTGFVQYYHYYFRCLKFTTTAPAILSLSLSVVCSVVQSGQSFLTSSCVVLTPAPTTYPAEFLSLPPLHIVHFSYHLSVEINNKLYRLHHNSSFVFGKFS